MKRPIVEVTWEDACRVNTWDEGDDLPTPETARTVGYLLDRNAKRLIIGTEYFESDMHWRDVNVIPAAMVRKVRVLR